jgi:hypothetical protein
MNRATTARAAELAEDYIVKIDVPAEITVEDAAQARLQECVEFLNSIPDLGARMQIHRTLVRSLEHIANIAKNYPNQPAKLFHDFAPLSMGWCAGNLVGGLIFHGCGVGGGSFPTLAVTLDDHVGWQLHT